MNCTISGNQASGSGGGIANAGANFTLLNTIVAQNTNAGGDPDVVGAFTSSGNNIIGNDTGSTGFTNGINADQVGTVAPFTGNITSDDFIISNVANTAGLVVGQLVTDSDGALPFGTVIAAVQGKSITLSEAANTSEAGDTFTCSAYAVLSPLQDNGGGIDTMRAAAQQSCH